MILIFYFLFLIFYFLFHLRHDSLKRFGVIHGEVGENLTVDFDAGLVEITHQNAVAEAFDASGGIDTLDPQGAEIAFLVPTVTESIGETLFPSVLGYGPNILAGTKVTASQLQNSFALGARSNVIY